MLNTIPMNGTFLAIAYALSAMFYLAQCGLIWYHWKWAIQHPHPPVWVRTNWCWTLKRPGPSPLTRGDVLQHIVLGFLPVANTMLLVTQAGAVISEIMFQIDAFWLVNLGPLRRKCRRWLHQPLVN